MTTQPLPGTLHVAATPDALAHDVAEWLVELSAAAIAGRGRFSIALAGGTTPRTLYELLGGTAYASHIDWSGWWCFFGDERACPATDPSSNYHMAAATLFAEVAINPAQVWRMAADRDDLDAAGRDYSRTLEEALGNPPVLDCVLLGLGENGHTASLFPGTAALDVSDAWCTRGRADYLPFDRMTLTYPTINAARHVAFLVTGDTKAAALGGVIAGTVPAARVRPSNGDIHWYLDAAAAGTLPTA